MKVIERPFFTIFLHAQLKVIAVLIEGYYYGTLRIKLTWPKSLIDRLPFA